VLEHLENYLFNCYDAIALLLMIKLTIAFRHVMERRKVTVLDPFFDRVTMLLWPR
jgi:vacuolar protein sorting-associated protein 52